MGKSSINIQPIKGGSEIHNKREKKLGYVREELSSKNESWSIAKVSDVFAQSKTRYQEKVGQKMQEKTTPIREGVFLFDPHHTIKDAKILAKKIEERFGVRVFQIHMHRDEGRWIDRKGDKIETKNPSSKPPNAADWIENLHGHMLFDWMDHKTGKSIKLKRHDMAEMQTMVATGLGMERGKCSDKIHLTSEQYKHQEAIKELLEIEVRLQTLNVASDEIIAKKRGLMGRSVDVEQTSMNIRSIVLENQRLKHSSEQMKIKSDGHESTSDFYRARNKELKVELKEVLEILHKGEEINPEYIREKLGIPDPNKQQNKGLKRGDRGM